MQKTRVPSRHLGRSWLVCMTAALFFFYIFVLMTMFNAINPYLMQAFSITDKQIGMLFSAYFYTNFILVFPAGLLLDRYSTKKLIIASMVLSAASIAVFSITSCYTVAFLCRLAIGVGGAFALVSCLRLASRWFPMQHMALISGSMITLGFLGGMVSQTPLTVLVEHVGWRHAMQWVALLGVVLIVIMLLIIREYPKWYQRSEGGDQVTSLGVLWSSIKNAISHYQNWLFGLYTSLVNLPIWVLGAAWGSMFYMQVTHFSAKQASYITSMLFIGAMIGSPLFGWISDKMRSRRVPMLFGAIVSLLITLVIMYVHNMSLTEEMILSFLLGLITCSQVLGYPAISESNPPEYVGGALGIGSMLIMAGGLVGQLFGWMMDRNWNHLRIHDVPFYSVHDYRQAMWILPIAFIISIIITLVVKETYPKG